MIARCKGSRQPAGIVGRAGIRKGRHGREAASGLTEDQSVAARREISTDGLGETDRGPARVRRGRARRPSAPGPTRTWSAAPCATPCSGARSRTSTWSSTAIRSALVAALGGDAVIHDRFETATVELPGGPVDVARGSHRDLPAPRARCPRSSPAGLADDLVRRDFTVNAIAVAARRPGRADRPARRPRRPAARACCGCSTSARSPTTRPGPCARPATPRGSALELEPRDAGAAARGRPRHGLGRPGRGRAGQARRPSPTPRRGFELLDEWGLIELAPGGRELIERRRRRCSREPPWEGVAPRPAAVLAAVHGSPAARELAGGRAGARRPRRSPRPRGRTGVELALARALGAAWLDRLRRRVARRSGSRSPART